VVAGHIAPQEIASLWVPEWAFGEEAVAGDLLERDVRADDRRETRVANLERGHVVRRLILVVAEFGSGGGERSTGPGVGASK
jgi:hypothetical protein